MKVDNFAVSICVDSASPSPCHSNRDELVLPYTKVQGLEVSPRFEGAKDSCSSEPHDDPDEAHSDNHLSLDNHFDALLFLKSCNRKRDILG